MRIDAKNPIILVEPLLFGPAGKCGVAMALDTGATFTMVPWHVAEKLGYDPAVSRERIPLITASTTEIVPVITMESIELLDFTIKKVKVAVHDLPPKSHVDGLLGLSFLKHFKIVIDFKKGSLDISK